MERQEGRNNGAGEELARATGVVNAALAEASDLEQRALDVLDDVNDMSWDVGMAPLAPGKIVSDGGSARNPVCFTTRIASDGEIDVYLPEGCECVQFLGVVRQPPSLKRLPEGWAEAWGSARSVAGRFLCVVVPPSGPWSFEVKTAGQLHPTPPTSDGDEPTVYVPIASVVLDAETGAMALIRLWEGVIKIDGRFSPEYSFATPLKTTGDLPVAGQVVDKLEKPATLAGSVLAFGIPNDFRWRLYEDTDLGTYYKFVCDHVIAEVDGAGVTRRVNMPPSHRIGRDLSGVPSEHGGFGAAWLIGPTGPAGPAGPVGPTGQPAGWWTGSWCPGWDCSCLPPSGTAFQVTMGQVNSDGAEALRLGTSGDREGGPVVVGVADDTIYDGCAVSENCVTGVPTPTTTFTHEPVHISQNLNLRTGPTGFIDATFYISRYRPGASPYLHIVDATIHLVDSEGNSHSISAPAHSPYFVSDLSTTVAEEMLRARVTEVLRDKGYITA